MTRPSASQGDTSRSFRRSGPSSSRTHPQNIYSGTPCSHPSYSRGNHRDHYFIGPSVAATPSRGHRGRTPSPGEWSPDEERSLSPSPQRGSSFRGDGEFPYRSQGSEMSDYNVRSERRRRFVIIEEEEVRKYRNKGEGDNQHQHQHQFEGQNSSSHDRTTRPEPTQWSDSDESGIEELDEDIDARWSERQEVDEDTGRSRKEDRDKKVSREKSPVARTWSKFRQCFKLKPKHDGDSCGCSKTRTRMYKKEEDNGRPVLYAPWYQARISRDQVIEVLSQEQIGAFIVRDSGTQLGCYALSVKVPKFDNPSGIAHYLIYRTTEGVKLKGLHKEWPHLHSLVVHLTVMPEMLPCPLRMPSEPHPTCGSADDSATDPNYQRLAYCAQLMQNLKPT